jgi:TusA-related sulfurtransferase
LKKIPIDAREMEHPIPLQLALNHLQSMKESEYLYMIHRKQPIPLIEVAKEKNFAHLAHKDNKDTWHILICKNQEANLKELLDV